MPDVDTPLAEQMPATHPEAITRLTLTDLQIALAQCGQPLMAAIRLGDETLVGRLVMQVATAQAERRTDPRSLYLCPAEVAAAVFYTRQQELAEREAA